MRFYFARQMIECNKNEILVINYCNNFWKIDGKIKYSIVLHRMSVNIKNIFTWGAVPGVVENRSDRDKEHSYTYCYRGLLMIMKNNICSWTL